MIFVDWNTSFSVKVVSTVLGTVNDWIFVVEVVIKFFAEVVEEVVLVATVVVIEFKVLAVVEVVVVSVEFDAVVVVVVDVDVELNFVDADVVLNFVVVIACFVATDVVDVVDVATGVVDVVVDVDVVAVLVVADTDGFTVGSSVTVVTFVVCVVDRAVDAGLESNKSTGTISKSSVRKLSSDSVSSISSWLLTQVKRPGKLIHSHLSGQL